MDRSRDVERFLESQDGGQETHTEWYGKIAWETDKSYKFTDGDGTEIWLPKSQVTVRKLSNGFEVKMPEWLAKKKGLI